MNFIARIRNRPFFIRLFHWEYWSFNAIYGLIFPVWFWLCLRARSLFFFAASNPSIRNGGFLNESKKDIAAIIPPAWHPATAFFTVPSNTDMVKLVLEKQGLDYPLIGKPNVGGRGRGVKVIGDDAALERFVKAACLDFHIQEFVPYKMEAGIFYYRFPNEEKGAISGIVRKEFLKVLGDGRQTLGALALQNRRATMYLPALQKMNADAWDRILSEGEEYILSPYGNHARGAMFLDDSHLADEQLREVMDQVCRQIPGFYFGRLDIRFKSWEDLKAGRHFSIIEVNGAGSEPTHIYDPSHSLFFAWKEIIRHWVLLYKISRINHRLGHPYLSWKEGLAMFRENRYWSERLAAMPD